MTRLVRLTEGREFGDWYEDRADVVIVGAGAGGPAAALELARAGLDVLLVEEGGWYPPEFYRNLRPVEAFKYLYRDYGMTAAVGVNPLRDPAIPFPLGKCVGGTTAINSGTCFRTPESVLDLWNREFGLEIDVAALDGIFEEVEDIIHAAPVEPDVLGKNAEVFRRGADKLGWHGRPLVRNARGCRGSGRCVFGCPTNAKQGTHLSYVPRALVAGARLLTDLRVESVLMRGARAQGVVGSIMDRDRNAPRGRFRLIADAVVIAAGAIGTPLLLQRSHVAVGNRHLGRNLRLHPGIRVGALFDETIEGWKGVPQGYYIDTFWKELGIMFEGIFVPPGVALPILPGVGRDFLELCRRYPEIASFGAMVKDTSAGTVRALGSDRSLITYALNRYDTERLVEAVKKACEIYFAAGARRVFPAIYGHTDLDSIDQVRRIDARRVRSQHLECMAFHPMGTARMAADPRQGVVDARGRVFDTDNVYVADASLFPTCLGVNPMESIFGFAHVIARGIAERWN
jgi:choline dehydrogenase-like flavoprotein